MPVTLLDTSLESDNDGDQIIVRSILAELPILRDSPSIPTHRALSRAERLLAKDSDTLVLTGTNILSSSPRRNAQWPLSGRTARSIQSRVVFLGVGWWQYQHRPSRGNAAFLRNLAHPGIAVAARDEYTTAMLTSIGVTAINTNCPTMWSLGQTIPAPQAREAVCTVTDYKPDVRSDEALLAYLSGAYVRVTVWPQGQGDLEYLDRLHMPPNVTVGKRGLSALDEDLRERDYVGTRLHAGVRAAQLGRSVTIQAVDNRAAEIGRDTGLPVVPRKAGIRGLEKLHARTMPTELHLERANQRDWLERFMELVGLGNDG